MIAQEPILALELDSRAIDASGDEAQPTVSKGTGWGKTTSPYPRVVRFAP